jgi:hypothetical protein
VGQTSRSRSQSQKLRYQYKGLVIRNTYIKYESPINYHSKDMANVKVFADRQTDEQAKNYMPPIIRYGDIKKNVRLSKSLRFFNFGDPEVWST